MGSVGGQQQVLAGSKDLRSTSVPKKIDTALPPPEPNEGVRLKDIVCHESLGGC